MSDSTKDIVLEPMGDDDDNTSAAAPVDIQEDDDFDFDSAANIDVAQAVSGESSDFDTLAAEHAADSAAPPTLRRPGPVMHHESFRGFDGDGAEGPGGVQETSMGGGDGHVDPESPPLPEDGRLLRHTTGRSIHKRVHDQKRMELTHGAEKTELQVRTLDSQLLPMWPYPVITAPIRDTVDADGHVTPGRPGTYLKRPWSSTTTVGGKRATATRITFPFVAKAEVRRGGDAVNADDEDDEEETEGVGVHATGARLAGMSKLIYMPHAYFDPVPAGDTAREWMPTSGGWWSDPCPVDGIMNEGTQFAMNWLAKVPFRVDKSGKPRRPDRFKTFQPNEYYMDESTMGPCARGRHEGDDWQRVGSVSKARRMVKRSVWDDAGECASHMLSAIAHGEGFAEVLFKSIRVLGGGSNVQSYLDATESIGQRTLNFQLAVERARSSLAQLSRFSVAAETNNKTMAPHAHGTIDFAGNTNQAPYLVVELQDFLPREDGNAETSDMKFKIQNLTRMLVLHLGIRPPRLIISLIGATQDSELVVTPKLRLTLKNGLMEAPDAWVFTSGLCGGVTKLVAEIMSEIRSSMSATSNINADYAVPVIGIVPISKLIRTSYASEEQREKHIDLFQKPAGRYHKYEAKDDQHLDPNHTFFVFVRDSERNAREGISRDKFDMCDVDFRRLWMKSLKQTPFESIVMWRRIHLGSFPVESFRVQGIWTHGNKDSKTHGIKNARRASVQGPNGSDQEDDETRQQAQEIKLKYLKSFTREALDDEKQNDHFLEHTTLVATLELCIAGTGDQETDEGYRSMKLLNSAVMHDYLSPVVVMQGSGGFADLVSYAYRFLHDKSPSASALTERGLDALVRSVFKVYTSGQKDVHDSFMDICTVCAVASKIVNFDVDSSLGDDLDKAFLNALTHTMRTEFQEDAVLSAAAVEKYKEILSAEKRNGDQGDGRITNYAKQYLNLQYEVQRDDEGQPLYETVNGKRVPIYKKSVCAEQGIDFEAGGLEAVFDDLVNRFELHLNMLRYAMGFDRVTEAAREITLLDKVWSKMLWWIERSLDVQFQYESKVGDKNSRLVGGKTMNSLKASNVPAVLIQERFIELFYATHERQRSTTGGLRIGLDDDDEIASPDGFAVIDRAYTDEEMPALKTKFLMLPDQYKLALEYALDVNKVGLVKLLVPKVADSTVNGYDIAQFLYGSSVTRPLDGFGSTLAELYSYEKHPAVKQYLHPILRVHTHRQDSTMVSLLKFATRRAVEAVVNEDVASGLLGEGEELESSQVRNNQRVRKVWSFVMQILKEDPSYLATTWGKTYEDIFDEDGIDAKELADLQASGQAYETPGAMGTGDDEDNEQSKKKKKKKKKMDFNIIPQSIVNGIATLIGDRTEEPRVPYKPWISSNFERNILLHKDIIAMQRHYDIEVHQQREDDDNIISEAERKLTLDTSVSKLSSYRGTRRRNMNGDDDGALYADGEALDFVALNGVVAPKVQRALAHDRTLESMWNLVSTKTSHERDLIAYHELMVWAVLFNRRELAEYFWQRGGVAIPSALMASVLFTGIADHPAVAHRGKLSDVVKRMTEYSNVFETHAVGVMDLCFQHDSLLTQEVLEAELDSFDWLRSDGFDSLKLARLAKNLEFISHPAIQAVIERKWKGGKAPPERRENFNGHVPVWMRWRQYLFAPRVSFSFDGLVFLMLMCVVAAVALEPITDTFSVLEWVQLAWFSGLVFEELRQLLGIDENAKESQRVKDALRDYISDFWNKIDVAIFFFYYLAVAIRFHDLEAEYNQRTSKGLYGFTVMLTYVKVLRFFQIHPDLGPKVTIFFTLFSTLWHYILLLLVFVVGFGIYLQTILNPHWNYRPFNEQSETLFWQILFRPYFQTYGELMLEDMEAETGCIGANAPWSGCGYQIQHTLPWILSVYLAITSIMIINMLIADFTMTFESIHEESTKHWRMGKLSLLDEYEDRTFLPPPLNLPWLICLVVRHLYFKFSGSEPDDDEQTLKAQEHRLIVEIFQDRLCDQYLSNTRENVDNDQRLGQIEAGLLLAQADIKFFKARSVSNALRVERKYFEGAIRSALADHPLVNRNSAHGGRLLFAEVPRTTPSTSIGAANMLRIVKSIEKHQLKVMLGQQSELDVYYPSTSQFSAIDFFVRKLHKGFLQPESHPLDALVSKAYRRAEDLPMTVKSGDHDVYVQAFDASTHDRNPFDFHEGMFRDLFMRYSSREFTGSLVEVEKLWNSVISKSAVSEPMQPGCNHMRLHIVTRWKRDSSGMVMEREGHPVLEFVAIKRKSASMHWSIPEIRHETMQSHPDIDVSGPSSLEAVGAAPAEVAPGAKVYKKSPVEYVAFHATNLREGISTEQSTKVAAELRELFGSYHEEPTSATPSFLFDGFLDDHRNTGISWIRATAFHFHDNRNLTEAWDLTYPGNIPDQPAPAEVAWLTVHAHLDLLGEQEDLLEHVAAKLSAYW